MEALIIAAQRGKEGGTVAVELMVRCDEEAGIN